MTKIEQKALELVNEVSGSGSWTLTSLSHPYNRLVFRSLCKAIERHEAFRQEVSDAVEDAIAIIRNDEAEVAAQELARFVITKLDPLVEAINVVIYEQPNGDIDETRMADALRAALAKRGLEIREKE